MHNLVQPGGWRRWQPVPPCGASQQIPLARRRQYSHRGNGQRFNRAACFEVDIGQLIQKLAGLADQFGTPAHAVGNGWPAGSQGRNNLIAQEIAIEARIDVAGIVQPADLVAIRIVLNGFARHTENRPQEAPAAKRLRRPNPCQAREPASTCLLYTSDAADE